MNDVESISYPCPSCGKNRDVVAITNKVIFEQYTTRVISSKCINSDCFLHDKVCDFYKNDTMQLIGE